MISRGGNRKIRILMYSTYFPPQYSGAATQSISLAKQLKKLDYHIEFATIRDSGLPEYSHVEGFPVHRIEAAGTRNKEFPFWKNFLFFSIKNRKKFDICHSHGAYYINSVIGPIAKMCHWKTIAKSSLSNSDFKNLNRSYSGYLHYLFLKMIDAYVAISRDLQSEMINLGLKSDKINFIPNGVDIKRFSPVSAEQKIKLRKSLNLPTNRIIALTIGVFDSRKNIGWLIEEWLKSKKLNNKVFLLAIGPQSREDDNGNFIKKLKNLAELHKSTIRIEGPKSDIECYYNAADFFILPSKSEGLPNVLLEAMASGLPCLSTDIAGSRDLLKNESYDFTFPINDFNQVETKIVSLFNQNMLEIGQRLRSKVIRNYDIKIIANQYHLLYNSLSNKS